MIPRLPAWQPGGSVVKDSRGTRVTDAPTHEPLGDMTAVALQGLPRAAASVAHRPVGGAVLRIAPIGEALVLSAWAVSPPPCPPRTRGCPWIPWDDGGEPSPGVVVGARAVRAALGTRVGRRPTDGEASRSVVDPERDVLGVGGLPACRLDHGIPSLRGVDAGAETRRWG